MSPNTHPLTHTHKKKRKEKEVEMEKTLACIFHICNEFVPKLCSKIVTVTCSASVSQMLWFQNYK